MKLVTWNVNGIRSVAKKGFFDYVKQEDPDIFCLQETKAHPQQLSQELLQLPEREVHWSSAHRPGYSGTATYLKDKPLKVRHGIGIRKFDHEGRFVITEHKNFVLYNVYFPNGSASEERHAFKQNFLEKFCRHLKSGIDGGRELIVVGDYNVAYRNIDVFDPVRLSQVSGFLPEEREWFERFLDLGFVDLVAKFYPEEKGMYTWWSYREKMARTDNRGWRIDHICVSKGLLNCVQSVEIQRDQLGSDHCPVSATLEI